MQIGFEIWTMQSNIMFDNIYIGHSVDDARKLADETFFLKHPIEELLELADKPKVEDAPKSPSDLKFLDDPVLYIKEKLDLFLTIAKSDPIGAIKFVPEAAGGIAAVVVTLIAIIVGVLGAGGSAAPAAKKVATDAKAKAEGKAQGSATGADSSKGDVSKRNTRSQS
jgi:calnexin